PHLPPRGVVGYLAADPYPENLRRFFLARLALAPVLIKEGVDAELVIAIPYAVRISAFSTE
ncbi:MAG: hypothetical protein V1899_12045, partial [Planctomycetota bacterium]